MSPSLTPRRAKSPVFDTLSIPHASNAAPLGGRTRMIPVSNPYTASNGLMPTRRAYSSDKSLSKTMPTTAVIAARTPQTTASCVHPSRMMLRFRVPQSARALDARNHTKERSAVML